MPLECQVMNIIYGFAISRGFSHSPNTSTDPQMATMKKAKSERLATPSNMPLALRVDASSHARTFMAEPKMVTAPPIRRKSVAPLPTHSPWKTAPALIHIVLYRDRLKSVHQVW